MPIHRALKNTTEFIKWIKTIVLCPFYIPHIVLYLARGCVKNTVNQDVMRYQKHFKQNESVELYLLYLLANDRYFRQLFYNRIGPIAQVLIRWYRPGEKYFIIPKSLKIGGGCIVFHPYATILNAEKIGNNFSCAHCTTLGFGKNGRPIIGDNVALGSNVTIIGGITIGNNVTVGAGSVVVKDVPANCIVAGNPAKIIRYKQIRQS